MAELPQRYISALMSGEAAAIAAALLFAVALLTGIVRIAREPSLALNNLRPGTSPGLLALVLLTLFASLGVIFAAYA